MRRVVVTGMGIVSPIGCGTEQFFAALGSGKNGIGPISRFDASGLDVGYAGEVSDFSAFAPAQEHDLFERDPKVAFAVAAAHEALSMAGVDQFSRSDLVHIGTSLETFFFKEFAADPRAGDDVFFRHMVTHPWRLPLDAALRRILDRYGNPGQAATNCSACAVGLQTIGQAFHAIRNGRFTRALAGGFDSMINPLGVGGFQLLGAPSTAQQAEGGVLCRPFDASRSGLVLGEGAGFVVLEEREQALAHGKRLYAEITGYGATLDACSLSAPDPEGEGAVRSMRCALQDAGLPETAVDHINAHGTGTHLNDPVEAAAIRNLFPRSWQRIPVTAIKSMTGHSIAAAGSIEAIACIYTLLHGIIPPNIGLEKTGNGCELMHVARQALPCNVQTVLTNSFGFGGQNASLIITRGNA